MIARILPPEIAARLAVAAEKARALRKLGKSITPEYEAHIKHIDSIAKEAAQSHPHLYKEPQNDRA